MRSRPDDTVSASVLDACPIPVIVHRDSILVFANRAVAETLEYPLDVVCSWVGKLNVFDCVAPEERQTSTENRDRILRAGKVSRNIQRVLLDGHGRRRMSLGFARAILWGGAPALEVSFTLLDSVQLRSGGVWVPSGDRSQPGRSHTPSPLTPRESQVAMLVARGFSTTNIACTLGIAESTVRTLLRGAFRKTGTHGRLELAQRVIGLKPG